MFFGADLNHKFQIFIGQAQPSIAFIILSGQRNIANFYSGPPIIRNFGPRQFSGGVVFTSPNNCKATPSRWPFLASWYATAIVHKHTETLDSQPLYVVLQYLGAVAHRTLKVLVAKLCKAALTCASTVTRTLHKGVALLVSESNTSILNQMPV